MATMASNRIALPGKAFELAAGKPELLEVPGFPSVIDASGAGMFFVGLR